MGHDHRVQADGDRVSNVGSQHRPRKQGDLTGRDLRFSMWSEKTPQLVQLASDFFCAESLRSIGLAAEITTRASKVAPFEHAIGGTAGMVRTAEGLGRSSKVVGKLLPPLRVDLLPLFRDGPKEGT